MLYMSYGVLYHNMSVYHNCCNIPNTHTAFHFRTGGNNYKRVRSTLPADDMGGERGEDGDEETLYDRTESTSQF